MQTVRTSLPIIQRIRMLATTPRLDAGEKWRLRKNLPRSGNEYGPLTELPDWSYADGTPGPISRGQRKRNAMQKSIAARIERLLKEVDASKEKS